MTGEKESLELLIEAGDRGLTLMWLGRSPHAVKGLMVIEYEQNDDPYEILEHLFMQPEFTQVNRSEVHIFFNYKDALLVPRKYHNKSVHEEMLSLVYGEKEGYMVRNEITVHADIYIVYRIPENIFNLLNSEFPNSTQFHSTSLQIKENSEKDELNCIVFYNSVKLILRKQGKLQLVQQYRYNTPEDVVYFLLNACKQYGMNAESVHLTLSGLIAEDSSLYSHLYNYFLHIETADVAEHVQLRQELKDFPRHFLSHLTALGSCE